MPRRLTLGCLLALLTASCAHTAPRPNLNAARRLPRATRAVALLRDVTQTADALAWDRVGPLLGPTRQTGVRGLLWQALSEPTSLGARGLAPHGTVGAAVIDPRHKELVVFAPVQDPDRFRTWVVDALDSPARHFRVRPSGGGAIYSVGAQPRRLLVMVDGAAYWVSSDSPGRSGALAERLLSPPPKTGLLGLQAGLDTPQARAQGVDALVWVNPHRLADAARGWISRAMRHTGILTLTLGFRPHGIEVGGSLTLSGAWVNAWVNRPPRVGALCAHPSPPSFSFWLSVRPTLTATLLEILAGPRARQLGEGLPGALQKAWSGELGAAHWEHPRADRWWAASLGARMTSDRAGQQLLAWLAKEVLHAPLAPDRQTINLPRGGSVALRDGELRITQGHHAPPPATQDACWRQRLAPPQAPDHAVEWTLRASGLVPSELLDTTVAVRAPNDRLAASATSTPERRRAIERIQALDVRLAALQKAAQARRAAPLRRAAEALGRIRVVMRVSPKGDRLDLSGGYTVRGRLRDRISDLADARREATTQSSHPSAELLELTTERAKLLQKLRAPPLKDR